MLKSLLLGFNHKQNASVCRAMTRASNEFYQSGLTIINNLGGFWNT